MKTKLLVAASTALCTIAWFAPATAQAQGTRQGVPQPPPQATVQQLIQALAAQQAEMDENNKKLQEKIAVTAESLRQANIFVARSGGRGQ